MGVLLIALGLAGWSSDCGAVAAANAPMTAAIRYAAEPPVIDGKLGDPAWNKADILTGFIVPVALDIARDPTEARVVFDEKGRVKFTFRMAENDPKGKWTLRVTDIMTGTTGIKNIQVY